MRPNVGLFLAGHNGSSATLGSLLGMHMGKPVKAVIAGLTGSSDQRGLAVYLGPKTPRGSFKTQVMYPAGLNGPAMVK